MCMSVCVCVCVTVTGHLVWQLQNPTGQEYLYIPFVHYSFLKKLHLTFMMHVTLYGYG